MNKLKIPENHDVIDKTLRLPSELVDDIQYIADMKKMSFNKVVTYMLEFGLDNLDEWKKAQDDILNAKKDSKRKGLASFRGQAFGSFRGHFPKAG